MDHLPGAGSRRRTRSAPRRTGASAARLPQDRRPAAATTQTRPAAGPLRAHRHEARGGGDEHADDHPLAAPGLTVGPRRLRAGADAEAELG